tara:strand:+ start:6757 stop:8574 length:1818 start_codon:yes stop_codon:yes gene_type:complete
MSNIPISKLEIFWSEFANKKICWSVPFEKALIKSNIVSKDKEYFSNWIWFKSGKLDLKKTIFKDRFADDIVFSFCKENFTYVEVTYADLLKKCSEVINDTFLSKFPKRVMIIGSASLETSTIMLSTALIGSCHSVLFEDLSVEAICERIKIFDPQCIYIKDTFDKEKLNLLRKSKILFNKKIEIFGEFFFKSDPTQTKFKKQKCQDIKYYNDLPKIDIPSEKYLFCLFTSGSTGLPKGIWHSYGGYLVYSAYTFEKYFLNYKKNNVNSIFCGTDAAWINGHTYALYGPLLTSTKSIFIFNLGILQNPLHLKKFIELTKPDFFYCSVTLLRAIRSYALITNSKKSHSSGFKIKGIGSCGEPLADDVAKWALKYFNSACRNIVNTYFQTETGGIISAPTMGEFDIKDFSTIGKSEFPVEINISKKDSSLSIPYPWPGCFSMVSSDRKPSYWDKKRGYLLHDIGFRDESFFLYIGGRIDDVINVSGHRVSTAEIESSTISLNKNIREAAAVGLEDSISGKKIVLFCVTSNKKNLDVQDLKLGISNKLTPHHKPWKIIFIDCLPKTKSGKIARRLLRRILTGNNPSSDEDLSTISNYDSFLKALVDINI